MKTRILIAVVVSLFLCQQAYAQDEPKAEATELEGTWEVVSLVVADDPRECDDLLWQFEGNRTTTGRVVDENRESWGMFSLNPAAVPAEIVIRYEIATMRGVYKIDDDLLTICLGWPGAFEEGTGPERFESSEDYPTLIWVLRRVEEDE